MGWKEFVNIFELPSMDQISVCFDKEWKNFGIFHHKMTYLGKELDRKDIDISSYLSQIDQVSPLFHKNWEYFEICHERIPYFEVGSTF